MEMLVHRRLVVYGEQFWRPYVHVRDAARAIATVLEAPAGRRREPGLQRWAHGRELSQAGSGRDHPSPRGRGSSGLRGVAEDPRDYKVSFERIRSALGFVPTIRVPDGVAEIAGAISAGVLDDLSRPAYCNVPRRLEPAPVASPSEPERMRAVILAGGRGTRLLPFTASFPETARPPRRYAGGGSVDPAAPQLRYQRYHAGAWTSGRARSGLFRPSPAADSRLTLSYVDRR